MRFTEQEETVLRIVQSNLPDTLTPYADIARAAGCIARHQLRRAL